MLSFKQLQEQGARARAANLGDLEREGVAILGSMSQLLDVLVDHAAGHGDTTSVLAAAAVCTSIEQLIKDHAEKHGPTDWDAELQKLLASSN